MILDDISKLSRESHQYVRAQCDFQESEKCSGIVRQQYRDIQNVMDKNNGQYICMHCSRHVKNQGMNNPNSKHDLNTSFFNVIDTHEKAYMLGWIASDGSISSSSWSIFIGLHTKDVRILENLRDLVSTTIPIGYRSTQNLCTLTLNSKEMVEDVCKHLNINRGKKSHTVQFPHHLSDDLKWSFIRGFFDGDGTIRSPASKPTPEISITTNSDKMRNGIKDFVGIPCAINEKEASILFSGTNAIDFAGKMYEHSTHDTRLRRKYDAYIDWICWRPMISGKGNSGRLPHAFMCKTDERAVLPSKQKTSDVGYDLTVIKVEKHWNNQTTLFDTGIKLSVAHGYYAEIVPRSSLSKSGYMLANSIGIVDPSYRGNLFVALTKVDQSAPDIELPFRCCQIIFRKQEHFEIVEVDSLDDTERGSGGFGSTG